MKNQTKADPTSPRNRHGWETLLVNVLLGKNGLEHYKADAKRRHLSWSYYVAYALREFLWKLEKEDATAYATEREAMLMDLLPIVSASVASLN